MWKQQWMSFDCRDLWWWKYPIGPRVNTQIYMKEQEFGSIQTQPGKQQENIYFKHNYFQQYSHHTFLPELQIYVCIHKCGKVHNREKREWQKVATTLQSVFLKRL